MPKLENPKLAIHLDLLRPQSNPEKIITKLLRWLLSSGRFIFILVEALVLIAFVIRFKLDADLANNRDRIKEQIPYIDNLKSIETLIRETQLKLSTISSFRTNYIDYAQILKRIADQTPSGVRIISINLQRDVAKLTIQLIALAQSNNDLSTFIGGLKQDPTFSEVNVTTVSFEHGSLNFAVNAKAQASKGKSL